MNDPKVVVQYFIERIQEMAEQLDPEQMPYDFHLLCQAHDIMTALLHRNTVPTIAKTRCLDGGFGKPV